MAEEVILPLFNDTNAAITGGAASTGLKIRRGADGYLFDWNDTTFKASGWTTLSATFTEIDATNLAGYYKKSGIDISGWNDGWYQVIAAYTGTPKRNAAEDWLVKGGKIVEQRTADNLDAQVSLTATQTSVNTIDGIVDDILVDTAVIGALGAGLTAVPWNAAWDAEVQSECVDALAVFGASTYAGGDTSGVTTLLSRASEVRLAELDAANLPTDIANVKVDTAAILIDTAEIGAAGAGLTALATQAKMAFVEKWILNKLVESPSGDTVTLYDDDGVTPLKTWTWNSATKTRGMAT